MSGLTKVLSMVHNPQLLYTLKPPPPPPCPVTWYDGITCEVLNLMLPSDISSICFPLVL
jgi:hypothetical protein